MDRFGRDPRECQRSLEFRIRLAGRFDQSVNLRNQFRVQRFRFMSSTRRIIVDAANPGTQFMQPRRDRLSSPAEQPFRLTGTPSAILPCHFRLELPPPKPGQLLRRRLNRRPHDLA